MQWQPRQQKAIPHCTSGHEDIHLMCTTFITPLRYVEAPPALAQLPHAQSLPPHLDAQHPAVLEASYAEVQRLVLYEPTVVALRPETLAGKIRMWAVAIGTDYGTAAKAVMVSVHVMA